MSDSARDDFKAPKSPEALGHSASMRRALAVLGWAWVAGMIALYLSGYPPRFYQWSKASEGWTSARRAAEGETSIEWQFPREQAAALGFAALCLISAWGLGRAAGKWTGLWPRESGNSARNAKDSTADEHAVAALGGLAILAMLVFALGCLGALSRLWLALSLAPGLLLAALGLEQYIPLICKRVGRKQSLEYRYPHPSDSFYPPHMPHFPCANCIILICKILAALALAVSLLAALAPAVESDGLRYHLFGPQEYLRNGRIHYIPNSAFTNFPFLIEMLFTLGLGVANDVAAKLLHWIHLPLAAVLAGSLAARMTSNRTPAAQSLARWLAAALFLSTPVAAIVAGWSFVDMGTTAYLLAALWALERWLNASGLRGNAQRTPDVIAAGFFCGAAVATKYTCLAPAAFVTAIVIFARRQAHDPMRMQAWGKAATSRRDRLRQFAAFALAGALCSGPWFAKNVILTGNPVYPFAHGIFGGGEWTNESAAFYNAKKSEKGIARTGRVDESSGLIEVVLSRALLHAPAPVRRIAFRTLDFALSPFDTAFYWSQYESQNPGPGYLLLFPWVFAWAASRWRTQKRRASDEDATEEQKEDNVAHEQNAADSSDAARSRNATRLVTAFALFCFVVFFSAYPSNRFLLIVWALAAACGGAMIASWMRGAHGRISRNSMPALGFSMLFAMLFASAWGTYWTARYIATEQNPRPIPAALGFVSHADYLRSALNYYPCVEWLGLHARPGEKAMYIGEFRGYPSYIPILASDWFDVPIVLRRIQNSADADSLLDGLLAEKCRYVLINHTELRMYMARYFRPRFTAAEWDRFQDLMKSPRLHRRWPESGGVYVSEILPRPKAQ